MKNSFIISLPIADRRRAVSFYRTVFDFQLVGAPSEDGLPEPLQFNLDDGFLLALIPADGLDWVLGQQPLAPSGHSECLLGITVAGDAEVDQIIQRVKDSDGSVITEASREDWDTPQFALIQTDTPGRSRHPHRQWADSFRVSSPSN